jgi:hypothetical protein
MRLIILVFFASHFGLSAQSIEVIPWKPSSIVATPELGDAGKKDAGRYAFYLDDALVYPHIATGGGWETVMVELNMGTTTLKYSTYFYDQSGNPLPVTFRTVPEGTIVTGAAISSTLPPGTSFNYSLFDNTAQTKVGWATVEYDTTSGRLGGYAIFRQRVAGRGTEFEALVPLSPYNDHKFFLPVDEIQGFETAMAVCNPASNVSTTVLLRLQGLNGVEIGRKTITLLPRSHTAFRIQDHFPEMKGRLGTLYVEGSTNRLSALGLRFNTSGGYSFSSIPIMNWPGMF